MKLFIFILAISFLPISCKDNPVAPPEIKTDNVQVTVLYAHMNEQMWYPNLYVEYSFSDSAVIRWSADSTILQNVDTCHIIIPRYTLLSASYNIYATFWDYSGLKQTHTVYLTANSDTVWII